MKKTIIVATILIALVISLMPMSVGAAYDYKTTNAIKGTPSMIDDAGNIDPIWEQANAVDVVLVNQTLIPSDTKTTGKTRTMWDENYFYILTEVFKDQAYPTGGTNENVDSTEYGIDVTNDKTKKGNVSAGDPNSGVFRIGSDNVISGFGDRFIELEDKLLAKSVIRSGGYITQMAIPWNGFAAAEGVTIGMEVQINVSETGEGRTGLVTWNSEECLGWSDSEAHGNVVLTAAPAIPELVVSAEQTPADDAGDIPPTPISEDTASSSPKTGDSGIIIFGVMIVSAGAVVFVRRRCNIV